MTLQLQEAGPLVKISVSVCVFIIFSSWRVFHHHILMLTELSVKSKNTSPVKECMCCEWFINTNTYPTLLPNKSIEGYKSAILTTNSYNWSDEDKPSAMNHVLNSQIL